LVLIKFYRSVLVPLFRSGGCGRRGPGSVSGERLVVWGKTGPGSVRGRKIGAPGVAGG